MTSLPTLPTDNLYKFLFISGLTIMLAAVLFGFNEYNKVTEKINSIELSLANDSLENAFILEDEKELYKESELLSSKVENLDSLQSMISAEVNLLKITSDSIGKTNKALNLKIRQAKIHSTTNSLKLNFLANDYRLLKLTIFISVLAFVVGCYLSKLGYNKWRVLVQKPLDEKLMLEVEELRNKMDRAKEI